MDKDTSSPTETPEIELFIIGGLISQNNDYNALIEHFRKCGSIHFVAPSKSCSLLNLSKLTQAQEEDLRKVIYDIVATTRSRLSELAGILIMEGKNIDCKQYESDALFLLGMYDNTDFNKTIYQEILKKATPLS